MNAGANLDYVGKIPDITYGVDEMSASERNEFLAWYEGQNDEVFDNKRPGNVLSAGSERVAGSMSRVEARIPTDNKHRRVSRIRHYSVGV